MTAPALVTDVTVNEAGNGLLMLGLVVYELTEGRYLPVAGGASLASLTPDPAGAVPGIAAAHLRALGIAAGRLAAVRMAEGLS